MPTYSASDVASMERGLQRANALSIRRRVVNRASYAVHCWALGSAFMDPSCNCLGVVPHPKLGSRRAIKVVVGSWYVYAAKSVQCEQHGPCLRER